MIFGNMFIRRLGSVVRPDGCLQSVQGVSLLFDWVLEGERLLIDIFGFGCVAPAGHTLLFAVRARRPHDGVSRGRLWRSDIDHDLTFR